MTVHGGNETSAIVLCRCADARDAIIQRPRLLAFTNVVELHDLDIVGLVLSTKHVKGEYDQICGHLGVLINNPSGDTKSFPLLGQRGHGRRLVAPRLARRCLLIHELGHTLNPTINHGPAFRATVIELLAAELDVPAEFSRLMLSEHGIEPYCYA